jgi:hypothetical protein
MGRNRDAEPQLVGAYEQLTAHFGPDSPDAVRTAKRLLSFYEEWDQAEPEKGHGAQAVAGE